MGNRPRYLCHVKKPVETNVVWIVEAGLESIHDKGRFGAGHIGGENAEEHPGLVAYLAVQITLQAAASNYSVSCFKTYYILRDLF